MQDYKIKIKSGDCEIVLSPSSVCRVLAGGLVGFDFPDLETSVQNGGFADGGFAYRRRICPRDISIHFEVSERAYNEEIRAILLKIMNPRRNSLITARFSGRERQIDVIPTDTPVFSFDAFGDFVRVKLFFIAPYPFFYSAAKIKRAFSDAIPLLSFPLNLMKGAGTVCGLKESGNTRRFNNTGDVPCGFTATLTAVGGTVVNPTISSGGKYIKVLGSLFDGDVLKIDTRYSSKSILYNGILSYSYDVGSSFFSLEPGENDVSVGAQSGENLMHVLFEFTPLYLGA